ncbi:hypothetical protein ABH945_007177 [Paraburkholderia sp. GAS333]|uniref:TetR family transcriptional regulator C-terminal domain-containing protein n=1 Tax=Paraburkholderia sp. GAS333 TaxID=3156279 RepID=UPI003D2377EE
MFREAVALYEAGKGGFADLTMVEEPEIHAATERVLRDAVTSYTRRRYSHGCLVVSAAISCSAENDHVVARLAGHRRARTQFIVDRLEQAVQDEPLKADANIQLLGDYATHSHGISVQAGDGIPQDRLLASIASPMATLNLASTCEARLDPHANMRGPKPTHLNDRLQESR